MPSETMSFGVLSQAKFKFTKILPDKTKYFQTVLSLASQSCGGPAGAWRVAGTLLSYQAFVFTYNWMPPWENPEPTEYLWEPVW